VVKVFKSKFYCTIFFVSYSYVSLMYKCLDGQKVRSRGVNKIKLLIHPPI